MYNLFKKEKAKLCPGGACEIFRREEIQKISWIQVLIVVLFIILIGLVSTKLLVRDDEQQQIMSPVVETDVPQSVEEDADCVVPDWAKKMGHAEQWKLHNGCE